MIASPAMPYRHTPSGCTRSRPNIFQLHVNTKPLRPVEFGTPDPEPK
jgi:hypothetical protein